MTDTSSFVKCENQCQNRNNSLFNYGCIRRAKLSNFNDVGSTRFLNTN